MPRRRDEDDDSGVAQRRRPSRRRDEDSDDRPAPRRSRRRDEDSDDYEPRRGRRDDRPRNPSKAAALEAIPGLFCVFGIGHIYSGNVGLGVGLMIGWWGFLAFSMIIALFTLGLVAPLVGACWVCMMTLSPTLASNACHEQLRSRDDEPK